LKRRRPPAPHRRAARRLDRVRAHDLIPAVERYFEFVQRTVDISRDVSIKFAEAGNKLSGVARERVESAGSVVREPGRVSP
jgi:hypothetical protein